MLGAGKQVFAEALAAGTMNNFFKLIEQFRTQVRRLLICMLECGAGVPHLCHGGCRLVVQHMHPGAGPPCLPIKLASRTKLCYGPWHGRHGHEMEQHGMGMT